MKLKDLINQLTIEFEKRGNVDITICDSNYNTSIVISIISLEDFGDPNYKEKYGKNSLILC